MPGQNLIDPAPNEFSILRSQSLRPNDLCQARERSQEVATVRARRPQRWHCVFQVIKVDAQLSSVHELKYPKGCRSV